MNRFLIAYLVLAVWLTGLTYVGYNWNNDRARDTAMVVRAQAKAEIKLQARISAEARAEICNRVKRLNKLIEIDLIGIGQSVRSFSSWSPEDKVAFAALIDQRVAEHQKLTCP